MLHDQATSLIKHPVISNASVMNWADLGCGKGLFTNALSSLLGTGSKIYAVDKDIQSFEIMETTGVIIEKIEEDFITDINLLNLDGILMANSLHFVSDKIQFIKQTSRYFKKQEIFLMVEYDTDIPNSWVPYPVSFISLQELFQNLGYEFIKKINELPSRYSASNIYSAVIKRY